MTCEETQEWILEFEKPDAAVDGHLSDCETCRGFLALQRSLDEQLTRAYTLLRLMTTFAHRFARV